MTTQVMFCQEMPSSSSEIRVKTEVCDDWETCDLSTGLVMQEEKNGNPNDIFLGLDYREALLLDNRIMPNSGTIQKEPTDVESMFNVFRETSPEQLIIINAFPWLVEFIRHVKSEIITNVKGLLKLMNFFLRHVSISVDECYKKPTRALKLRTVLSDALMLFYMTYCGFKFNYDHYSYLQKMSDLMAIYMDMEMKASRSKIEPLLKTASRITSSFYIYFGKAPDYIIDTIFKAKLISKTTRNLCDLLFRRVLRDCDKTYVDGISYVRYLLAFKIWKAITEQKEHRLMVVELACSKLKPPPGFVDAINYRKELSGFLPRIPSCYPDVTNFFMRAKFKVKEKIKTFFRLVENPGIFALWMPLKEIPFLNNKEKIDISTSIDNKWTELNPRFSSFNDLTNTKTYKNIKYKNYVNATKSFRNGVIEIIDLIESGDHEVQGDQVSSVQEDDLLSLQRVSVSSVQDDFDDLVITSSLSEEDQAKLDEIYSATIDSCAKPDGEVHDNHLNVVMCSEPSNNSNLYNAYEDSVASTGCLKGGFDALLNDAFERSIIGYNHPIDNLSDVAAAVKEGLMMLDCKRDSTTIVTSTSDQQRLLNEYSLANDNGRNDNISFDSMAFTSNSLILDQDNRIKPLNVNNILTENRSNISCRLNVVVEGAKTPPPPLLEREDRINTPPSELKLQTPGEVYYEYQDIVYHTASFNIKLKHSSKYYDEDRIEERKGYKIIKLSVLS